MVKIASGIIAFLLVIWSAAFYWDYRVEKAADEYYQARKLEDQHQQIEALKQIATQYVRTPSGKLALFELARHAQAMEKDEDTKGYYQQLVKHTDQQPMLHVSALHGLGALATKQEKHDEALSFYKEAASFPHNMLKVQSQYQEALSLQRLGKKEEAQKIFEEIRKQDKETVLKEKSEEHLLWYSAHP